jgi:hypothetical protein
MSSDIVRTLGQMVPPTMQHLFVDDYWKALGIGIGQLHYVPEVVIEHMHPSAGKAEMDDSYAITNHPDRYESDGAAWKAYRDDGPCVTTTLQALASLRKWTGACTTAKGEPMVRTSPARAADGGLSGPTAAAADVGPHTTAHRGHAADGTVAQWRSPARDRTANAKAHHRGRRRVVAAGAAP